ncbi:MAG TPA: tRNA dihydrouridine synthase DusB, partial [Rikenellaceae bacterium]|nr:tRNA dihydrouridine synthase DusB [Rikenellaceae bacterium]
TFGHPWIFKEIRHYLDTGEELPDLSISEKVDLAKRHLALSLDLKSEPRGIFEMRRHLSCYFKGLPDFKETRIRMVTTLDVNELYSILDGIKDKYAV